MDPDTEISFDFAPFLCQYKSGRVVRHGSNATVPAGTDPLTGIVSKDIHVGGARARVYLPPGTAESPARAKLPVIVYFHGGGFVVGSPADPSEHGYLNDLVAVRGLLVVHPYFNGTEAVGAEASLGPEVREYVGRVWRFVSPGSVGLDDPLVNPFAVARIPCERVLVCVAEHDAWLKERALWYYRELKASGYAGEVELFESKGVGHAFHFDELQERTVAFITK